MASTAPLQLYEHKSVDMALGPVFIYSFIFHAVIFVGIPLMTRLVWRPKVFERPQTFQLVQLQPTMMQQERIVEKPRPRTEQKKEAPKKPVPKKKESTRPVPKKEEVEDLNELKELLGDLPQPVSKISIGKVFPYQWYLNNIQMKVERNWKPPVNDEKMTVVLRFTIFANGRISDIAIERSSGNSMLDNLAVRAVTLAAPFGKIPAGWGDDRLELSYSLIPAVR